MSIRNVGARLAPWEHPCEPARSGVDADFGCTLTQAGGNKVLRPIEGGIAACV